MTRGGFRPGSGRPKGKPDDIFRKVSVSLSPDTLALIDSYAKEQRLSRSAAVEKLSRLGLKSKGA
jgi:metal-responsive CopG/Arc/MetJ family transcriptional regulator